VSLPTVASPVGVNAEYVRDGITGFYASNILQWVEGISKLIEDAELRSSMGRKAKAWVQKFDKINIEKQLVELIKET
jgi:glycosyltransferase involved in cell wall biosynthesis